MSPFDRGTPPYAEPSNEALEVLWRRRWVVLAVVVLLPLVVYVLSSQREDRYQAHAVLQVHDASIDALLLGTPATDSSRSVQTLAAAATLVRTRRVAQVAAATLRPPEANLDRLLARVSVATDVDSGFLTIIGEARRPEAAASVANAFAGALIRTRAERALEQIDGAVAQVQNILQTLPPNDTGRAALLRQTQRLRARRAVLPYNAEVVEPAIPPDSASSPRPLRDAMIGLALAVLLGIGLASAVDRVDRRIRDPLEVESLAGTRLLAVIESASGSPDDDGPMDAFRTLGANITYLGADHSLKTVVICSAFRGEGRTTVAAGLAIACAREGRSVVLVDADLRHARGKPPLDFVTESGLSGVLVDRTPLGDALIDNIFDWAGELRVLPSGPPLARRADVLALRMPEILEDLAKLADLVIVDTPPALAAADAMTMLDDGSGIILVAQMGRTTRTAFRQVAREVSGAGGTVIGAVATGGSRRHAPGPGSVARSLLLRQRRGAAR
jgi:Mrp family chromosome partitioning ATPase